MRLVNGSGKSSWLRFCLLKWTIWRIESVRRTVEPVASNQEPQRFRSSSRNARFP